MFSSSKKIPPQILKVYQLSSILCIEEQIKFLDRLIFAKNQIEKNELIERVLNSERVWEKEKAVEAAHIP